VLYGNKQKRLKRIIAEPGAGRGKPICSNKTGNFAAVTAPADVFQDLPQPGAPMPRRAPSQEDGLPLFLKTKKMGEGAEVVVFAAGRGEAGAAENPLNPPYD
jgi:hypothetical protein